MGVDSTYEIHMGKSKTGPIGPYYDKNGEYNGYKIFEYIPFDRYYFNSLY